MPYDPIPPQPLPEFAQGSVTLTECEIASAREYGREAPGFPGYLFTPWGGVYSTWRVAVKSNIEFFRMKQCWSGPRQKSPAHRDPRRLYAWIRATDRREQHHVLVHRYMLLALVGPPPEGQPNALHNDDNPANNTLENLRWGSYDENMQDRLRNGRMLYGEKNSQFRLTEDDIRAIRAAGKYYGRLRDLGQQYGVSRVTINLILQGKTWKGIEP